MSLFKSAVPSAATNKDFDYLAETDIYLDSACQTLRPQPVIEAMETYFHGYNTCGGRVKYEWGRQVDAKVQDSRDRLLKLVGKSQKDYVCAFTLNTTYGINLLLSQLPADTYQRIVTSDTEHNSVFLPSITYARRFGWERQVLERAPDGSIIYQPDDLEKAVVIVNSASNFDGRELANARQLADDAHRHGGLVILDGAQTMGHNPAQLKDVDFDAVCFSGHKMYGPSLGVIIIKAKILDLLSISFIGGGTVEDVDKNDYRLVRDDKAVWLEPGLQDFAGIIGLGAAVDWLSSYRPGGRSPGKYEAELAQQLHDGIRSINSIELLNQTPRPIISFYSPKIDAHRLAIYLSAQGIMARSGYFCCHYYLDHVKHLPPLLRLSIGLNNTETQITKTVETIKRIVEGA